jgi:hypothetical protein
MRFRRGRRIGETDQKCGTGSSNKVYIGQRLPGEGRGNSGIWNTGFAADQCCGLSGVEDRDTGKEIRDTGKEIRCFA